MKKLPADLDSGTRYVVFYSRSCDHCEEMFTLAFVPDPGLAAMTTAVEIPFDTNRLRSPDAWPMPQTACELLSLPLGCDWIITPPLALRIEDGIVRCANEGDHHECMGLEADHDH